MIATIAISAAAVTCALIAAFAFNNAMRQGYQFTASLRFAKPVPPKEKAAIADKPAAGTSQLHPASAA